MEDELLKIFDEDKNFLGVATREEIHKLGHWHETFHCWFIGSDHGENYIYLQLRSDAKKDYPSLLDITAAGHILSNETVEDGIREVEEELGIKVPFNQLNSLGIIGYTIVSDKLIDREFAHTFIYRNFPSLDEFHPQLEEVAGIVRTEFRAFADLWRGREDEIKVEGVKFDDQGNSSSYIRTVGKESFVPHPSAYFEAIIKGIDELLERE